MFIVLNLYLHSQFNYALKQKKKKLDSVQVTLCGREKEGDHVRLGPSIKP